MDGKPPPPPAEIARRAAQSARDRAEGKKKKGAGRKLAGTSSRKKAVREFRAKLPMVQSYEGIASAGIGRVGLQVPRVRAHDAVDLLAALLDPDHNVPFRLPGGAPTFVNKLRRKIKIQQPPPGARMQVNAGYAIVRRDPRLGSIHFEYKASGQQSQYALRGQASGGTLAMRVNTQVAFALAEFVSGWERHDDWMVPVVFRDGVQRVWFQNEAEAPSQIACTGLTGSASYTLTITWMCNGQTVTDNLTASTDVSGNVTFTLPNSDRLGYVGFMFTSGTSANSFGLTLIDNSKNAHCHMPLPELRNSALDVDNMRVNAASLMLSDRSNVLISQGNCLSYQGAGGEDWTTLLQLQPTGNGSIDPYGLASRSQKPYTAPYKEGRYIPLKPVANPQEEVMLELFDGGDPESVSNIQSAQMTDYLFVSYNIGGTDGNVTPQGEYTMCWHIEGETESQWKDNEIPRTHPDAWKDAKYAFSQLKCDLGNPDHLKKLWSFAKSILPKLFGAADMIAPVLPPQYRAPVMMATNVGRYLTS